MTKPTILFVDDEPNILNGLMRNLRKMRQEWEMLFMESGQEALDYIATSDVDVIVSDMRMPGMDGAELLTRVSQCAPHVIRFILSGQTDEEQALRMVGVSHQFLSKPCKSDVLVNQVTRAIKLRDMVPNRKLQTDVAGLQLLPCRTSVQEQLLKELKAENPSPQEIAALVTKDIALAARFLQIASSGYFGLSSENPNLSTIVNQLGMERVKALVYTQGVEAKGNKEQVPANIVNENIWDQSLKCGDLCQAIAKHENLEEKQVLSASIAGLLHDVGALLLANFESEKYERVLEIPEYKIADRLAAEEEMFNTTHSVIGAYLAGLWGFPDSILRAIAHHHSPLGQPDLSFGVLSVVHIAQGFCMLDRTDPGKANIHEYLCMEYLEKIGGKERLSEWERLSDNLTKEVEMA